MGIHIIPFTIWENQDSEKWRCLTTDTWLVCDQGKTGIQLCLTGKSVFSSLYWGVTVADLVHYSQWHIALFNKYLSNTSYVPGTVLSTRIHMVDIENKSSCLCRGYIPVEGDTWKQWKEFLKSYEVLESNKWHGKRQLSEGDGVS